MRFFLKEGIKFHSGNELSSHDIAFTFSIINNSEEYANLFSIIDSIEIIDEYTFDIITKKPTSLILNVVSNFFPLEPSKKHFTRNQKIRLAGAGPYTLLSTKKDNEIQLKQFDNYWDKENRGNVDIIKIQEIQDDKLRATALLAGDVDIINPAAPDLISSFTKKEDINALRIDGTTYYGLQLNQENTKEFKDKRVRLAVDFALDKKKITDTLFKNLASPASQYTPKNYLGYNPVLEPRFNLPKAKSLMYEAGYPNGFDASMFINDSRRPIAEMIVNMLKEINININLKTLPTDQYWDEFDKRSADIFFIGWSSDTQDSASFWENLIACPNKETGAGFYNSSGFCNPEIDELITSSNYILDRKKREELLKKIEARLYEEAAHVPLYWMDSLWASRKEILLDGLVTTGDIFYAGDLVIK